MRLPLSLRSLETAYTHLRRSLEKNMHAWMGKHCQQTVFGRKGPFSPKKNFGTCRLQHANSVCNLQTVSRCGRPRL